MTDSIERQLSKIENMVNPRVQQDWLKLVRVDKQISYIEKKIIPTGNCQHEYEFDTDLINEILCFYSTYFDIYLPR